MLTLHTSANGRVASQYLHVGLSKEGNYYLDEEIKAFWYGDIAKFRGIHGKEVEFSAFESFVNNRELNGERITPRDANNRRAGFDWCFSPAKCVSVLHAMTGDQEIETAIDESRAIAMREAEKLMYAQANTQEQRGFEHTGNILYSPFKHYLSRPVPVKGIDGVTRMIAAPALHQHCFVQNFTWSHNRNKYLALEPFVAHSSAPLIQEIFHTELTKRLNKMGYQIHRTNDESKYRIAGITRSIVERFSLRQAEIEDLAKERNITSAKEKAKLSLATRHSKVEGLPMEELQDYWKDQLSPEEYQSIINLKGQVFERQERLSVSQALDRALEHCLQRESAVQESRLLSKALTYGYGHFTHDDIRKELSRRSNIIQSDDRIIRYVTTKEMVQAENEMIKMSVDGKGLFPPIHPEYQIKQDFLNQQQQNAVWTALNTADQFSVIRGAAGVGKSTSLNELQTAALENNMRILAVAPSSQARDVLLSKGYEAETVAALLVDPRLQEKIRNNILLVDEAGLLGTQAMSDILRLATENNTRTIFVGDSRQNSSPEHGDALRILEDKAGLTTATMDEVKRQKSNPQYLKAVSDLAKGKTHQGYQTLDRLGAIKEVPDQDERHAQIAEEVYQSKVKKQSVLVVSPTNYEGQLLNKAIRDRQKRSGHISGSERVFETLRPLSMTEAEKKDLVSYGDNQVCRFVQNHSGFKAGSHYEVISNINQKQVSVRDMKSGAILNLPHETPEKYQVYEKTKTLLAQGDLIRLTNNGRSLSGSKLSNGNTYEVRGFVKNGIRLSNNQVIADDFYHIKHGYCDTSFSSQGKDASKVIISMSDNSFAATNEASFYVAASRGRDEISIYTSDKDNLKKTVMKNAQRVTAQEIAQEHQERLVRQRQQAYYNSLTKQKTHGTQQRTQYPERSISKKYSEHRKG